MKNNYQPKSISRLTIEFFVKHALKYKYRVLIVFVSIAFTYIVMYFYATLLQAQVLQRISDGDFDSSNLWASFRYEIIAYSVATILTAIAGWRFNIWVYWQIEMRVLRDIAQRVFNHLIKLDANFHANRFGGSLVSQTNKLLGAYLRFADAMVFNLYTLVLTMIVTVIVLGPKVPLYAAMITLLSIIYIIGAIYFSKPVRDANRAQAVQESRQTGQLADSITNIMAVKSFAAEDHESDRYWKEATKTKDLTYRSMVATTYRETFASSLTTAIGIASLIIAIVGTRYFGTNISTLFLIVSFTSNISMRLWDFQNVLRQINRALGDASDMISILQIVPAIKDPAKPQKAAIRRGEIELSNVTFTHAGKPTPLFKNLNVKIKAGEKVGLVGHSGSGKTTLTSILLRFADVDSGSITIDGQDIREITQHDLRKHITYVPQEPLLFHRSLAENINYARPSATQKEIEGIAKLAHAHEFIMETPEKYKTLVGERGVKLSGGQRQRVAIARAMLKNAPILVLDEATSALDSESEVLIQDALWKLMEGKTAVVIAHRLSTIQKMDRILVMENGKITEQGTHKELIRQNGTYAELWSHQSGGFLED